jgi:uncharacterized protein (DUF1330 family)
MSAKGYWIARVEVTDPAGYEQYRQANAAPFARYGARFLVRGGSFEVAEGGAKSRNVVIEFDSYEQAVACFHSPEYQHAKSLRQNAAFSDLIIIQGYDGPQPGGAQ